MQPTVGVDFIGKNISHNNQHFRLQLWDTAGQERFRSLVPNYLKDATCAVFVVDLSSNSMIRQMRSRFSRFTSGFSCSRTTGPPRQCPSYAGTRRI